MLRTLARWWARRRYIWRQHLEGATEELQAALSAQRAQEKRDAAAQLRKDADDMEARVKQMAEMEKNGFMLCDSGHENVGAVVHKDGVDMNACVECGAPTRIIKRDLMTGQEQYESDKQRKEVETMISNKRATADRYDTEAQGGEDTAKNFRNQAASSRDVAERLRKL